MLLPCGVVILRLVAAANVSNRLAVGSRLVGRLGSLALIELVGEPLVLSSVVPDFFASLLAALSLESRVLWRF